MLDFRVKKPSAALNWRYQEIIVTQERIDQHGLDVRLDDPYELGKKVLDVYYQGQRLTEGGGFVEVDTQTIRLDLGEDEEGNPVPLRAGDEIVIKEWYNSTSPLYGVSSLNQRITALEVEVHTARGGRNNLDQRLDSIEEDILGLIEHGNGSSTGSTLIPLEVGMQYTTDGRGNVTKEESTGDLAYVKDLEYDGNDNMVKETVTFEGQVHELVYGYDANGFLTGQSGQRLELVTMLSYLMQKDVSMLLGEGDHDTEWDYDDQGQKIKMVISGGFSLIKEWTYNGDGTVHQEIMTHRGRRTTKTYQYDPVTKKKTKAFSTIVTV
jgi:hypothetical protein